MIAFIAIALGLVACFGALIAAYFLIRLCRTGGAKDAGGRASRSLASDR
jgi:hypothetical protein